MAIITVFGAHQGMQKYSKQTETNKRKQLERCDAMLQKQKISGRKKQPNGSRRHR